jgi:hypothetical protein
MGKKRGKKVILITFRKRCKLVRRAYTEAETASAMDLKFDEEIRER